MPTKFALGETVQDALRDMPAINEPWPGSLLRVVEIKATAMPRSFADWLLRRKPNEWRIDYTLGTGESEETTVHCPDCESGDVVGMFPKYVEGTSGPPAVLIKCGRCNGTGTIPSKMLKWIELGKQCRIRREIEDLGLRSGAVEYGMRPSELSRIECGQVDPTEHAKELGVID